MICVVYDRLNNLNIPTLPPLRMSNSNGDLDTDAIMIAMDNLRKEVHSQFVTRPVFDQAISTVNEQLKTHGDRLSSLSDQTKSNTGDIKHLTEAFDKDSKSCQIDRDDLRKLLQQLQDRLSKLESTKTTGGESSNNSHVQEATLKDIL